MINPCDGNSVWVLSVCSVRIDFRIHAIQLRENQTSTSGEKNIDSKMINSEETSKLSGVTLDYRLGFDLIFLVFAERLQHSLMFFKD